MTITCGHPWIATRYIIHLCQRLQKYISTQDERWVHWQIARVTYASWRHVSVCQPNTFLVLQRRLKRRLVDVCCCWWIRFVVRYVRHETRTFALPWCDRVSCALSLFVHSARRIKLGARFVHIQIDLPTLRLLLQAICIEDRHEFDDTYRSISWSSMWLPETPASSERRSTRNYLCSICALADDWCIITGLVWPKDGLSGLLISIDWSLCELPIASILIFYFK